MNYYVYKVAHTETNEFYYGSRQCECTIEDDRYMGSMCTWKPDKTKLVKEIIKTGFINRLECTNYEAMIIEQHIHNPLNQNWHIPKNGFCIDNTGTIVVKDINNNMFRVKNTDPRYLSGELVGCNKGTTRSNPGLTYVNHKGEYVYTTKDDPRVLSGELKHMAAGKIVVRDKDGNTFQTSVDDPRYLSGEFVSVATGAKHLKNTIWVNNGTDSTRIKEAELNAYLSDGWVMGRIISTRQKNFPELWKDEHKVITLYNQGMSKMAIARLYGCTDGTIRKLLKKNNIK